MKISKVLLTSALLLSNCSSDDVTRESVRLFPDISMLKPVNVRLCGFLPIVSNNPKLKNGSGYKYLLKEYDTDGNKIIDSYFYYNLNEDEIYMKGDFFMPHSAQAIVLSCIDFRFRQPLAEFLAKELNLFEFDHKTDGGGVKQLLAEGPVKDWILANLEIAFNLHDVSRIILVNHQDCGAYGGSSNFNSVEKELAFHRNQLTQAALLLKEKYPNMQVQAYLGLLGNSIKFEEVA